MKTFKEGDKVRIKDNLTLEDYTPTTHILPSMLKYVGRSTEILTIDEDGDCLLDIMPNNIYWSPDWLEPIEEVENEWARQLTDRDFKNHIHSEDRGSQALWSESEREKFIRELINEYKTRSEQEEEKMKISFMFKEGTLQTTELNKELPVDYMDEAGHFNVLVDEFKNFLLSANFPDGLVNKLKVEE